MTGSILTLIAALVVWMGICAWSGFGLRFVRFLAVLVAGLALYMVWIVIVLRTTPLEPNAIAALMSATLYALTAFGCGYLAGRVARQFQASRVSVEDV